MANVKYPGELVSRGNSGSPWVYCDVAAWTTRRHTLISRTDRSASSGWRGPILKSGRPTVGYAHAHDGIARYLTRESVMFGAFAEVQVMDWGLGKVFAEETPATTDTLAAEQ